MEIIQSAIIHSIDTLNYDTAQFLAERLVAQDPYNLEYTYLLAKSHVLIGHYQTAFMLLDPTSNCLKIILLFATCCLHLKKFTEGDVTVTRWIDQYHNGSLIRY
ncbi:hypothetical protein BC833DRAFT_579029 [Globomyces pollinis-pini]|nr:hypothetical protein BC833DRAFT_579029 [Globomyces pollinis-pini]